MELNHGFIRLSESLLQIQRDFDYGDELLLRRHGSVDGAQIRVGELPLLASSCCHRCGRCCARPMRCCGSFMPTAGRSSRCNRCLTRIEGVPRVKSWASFLEVGIDRRPQRAPGDQGSPGRDFRSRIWSWTATLTRFHACSYQERRWQEKRVFFLVNTHRERRVQCTARIRGRGPAPTMGHQRRGEVVRRAYAEMTVIRIVTEVSIAPAGVADPGAGLRAATTVGHAGA